jgi:hypothetical protein
VTAAPDAAGDARGTETRRTPRVGDEVYIVHLAALESATVMAVHDEGRRLEVRGDEVGAALEFVLSLSTGRFVSGGSHGLRLRWAQRSASQDGSEG